MKYFKLDLGGREGWGVLEGDNTVKLLSGSPFDGAGTSGETLSLAVARTLPPCAAGGMICLWKNSRGLVAKFGWEAPKEALYFVKPASALATHGDDILWPRGYAEKVVLEAELGVVIGKRAWRVSAEEARSHIFGYTVINDVTVMDIIKRDASFDQWTRSKGFPSFGLCGPAVETEVDLDAIRIQAFINGKEVQNYPVSDLYFDPAAAVASISQSMVLQPGDVIALGTSLGVKPINPGDEVEIRIDGIGALVNRVAEA